MAQHYSTKDFFRYTPNALLARYFKQQKLFTDLDFSTMKEAELEPLYEAWEKLDIKKRKRVDAELKTINDLSCKKGILAVIDEAPYQFRESPEQIPPFIDKLSKLKNHYDRAMTIFLDHKEFWPAASRFYQADNLSYWRKRSHMGHKPAAVDKASIDQLAEEMGTYFHDTETCGKNCEVEPYRRGDLDYFFCFPEDHSQKQPEWVKGKFKAVPHTPAFVIVLVYSQERGALDINYQGSKKILEPLQTMFATNILKLDKLPPNPKDSREYDLNILANKDFSFAIKPGSSITGVTVKKIRLSAKYIKGERLTLEADTNTNNLAVYELMEKLGEPFKASQYNITQVDLAVSFSKEDKSTPKSAPITIGHPNSCSLKYDELGIMLRTMLEDSNIEPKEPTKPSDA